jgi:hypothetical protein
MAKPGLIPTWKKVEPPSSQTARGVLACALEVQVGPEVRHVLDRARDHVLPRGQQTADVVEGCLGVGERRPERRVADAVGLDREDLLDVVGGANAQRLAAEKLAGVFPDLVGVVHAEPDQLVVGALDDGPQRVLPHVARAPLDDAVGHLGSFDAGICGASTV